MQWKVVPPNQHDEHGCALLVILSIHCFCEVQISVQTTMPAKVTPSVLQGKVNESEKTYQQHSQTLRSAESTILEQRLRISELEMSLQDAQRSLRDSQERQNLDLEGLEEMNNLRAIAHR